MKEYIKYNDILVERTEEVEQELFNKNIEYEIGYLCKDCGCFVSISLGTTVQNSWGELYI